jgi:predicted esterase YcpF (UPF0227 family)
MSTASYPDAISHLLYLHGFRSSPQSTKARLVAARVAQSQPGLDWCCPQLPPSPQAAMALIRAATAHWPASRMAVIGSSLGGFYASALAAERACRRVLINPAVDPGRDLARYIGEQPQWHAPEQHFYFQPAFIAELDHIKRQTAQREAQGQPPSYALIAKGDEVLDWREMVARYPQAELQLLEGGDHAVSDFACHLDAIWDFLHLR